MRVVRIRCAKCDKILKKPFCPVHGTAFIVYENRYKEKTNDKEGTRGTDKESKRRSGDA